MPRAYLLLGVIACAVPPSTPVGPAVAKSAVTVADVEQIAEPNRPLTEGEIALLRPIYREGIDYAKVRVINNSFPLQPENVYMTPRGHVYAPGTLFEADFSKASRGRRGVFVHEIMHVWQYFNGMDLVQAGFAEFTKYMGDYERAYPYELERGRDLVEYGMEQQASIVEDYFMVTVEHDLPRRLTNRGLTDTDRDGLYAAVLAKFLANARYARSIDAKGVANQHARSSEQARPGPAACKESEQEHGESHLCEWRYQPTKK
jgi:hypothetical protein